MRVLGLEDRSEQLIELGRVVNGLNGDLIVVRVAVAVIRNAVV